MSATQKTFAVAPMMEWTDRHCRYFHRLLTRHAVLYTEMVTADAVIHGDRERLIGFDPAEHPVALQLGGSEPEKLARAAAIGADWGYDQIDLNCGCPSDRVQSGRFGAALMAEPDLVADCVAAMKAAVAVPVTVKCRIGIDDQDAEEDLDRFVDKVVAAGVDALTVHARKAWLQGLSPKENRDIPPLDHDRVYRLKRRLPDLPIVINGGIASLEEAARHLAVVDGVMLGRAAYHDPALLLGVDALVAGEAPPLAGPQDAVEPMIAYAGRMLAAGVRLNAIARHMLGLFQGVPGARAWRRILTVESCRPGAGTDVFRAALAEIVDGQARLAEREREL
ncbi:MAG: tRNA dihydrouridine(20/20a) synthase DusA [Hyphomicrobiales bacterium]